MTAEIILEDVTANREQWLAMKKNKVSSSNIAAIAGLSKWRSPLEVWAEWTGKEPNTFQGNRFTQLGNLLEPFVADLYSERTGREVRRANALYANKEYPFAVVSPDYFEVRDDDTLGVLEIKTGTLRQIKHWTDGRCPEEYIAQLQFQLGILDIDHGTLTAFLGLDTDEDYTHPFQFDAEMFALLIERAEEFLDLVKRDVPPDAGPGDSELIRKIVRRSDKEIYFEGDTASHVAELLTDLDALRLKIDPLKQSLKPLDELKKTAENQLKLFLAGHEFGVLPDGRVVRHTVTHVVEKKAREYDRETLSLPKAGK